MVTIDCADATELATFYSRLLGMTIAYQDDNVAMITGESGPAIGFGKVDHYTPPPWPDEKSQKQFHLDLKVADIAAAEAAVRGARGDPTRSPARRRPLAGACSTRPATRSA